MADKKTINILHLYPDLLNLYGDKGNIASLKMRLEKRNIDVNIKSVTQNEDAFSLENIDIVFFGGGSDKEQELVCKLLKDKSAALREYVEAGGVFLAFCGGFNMSGREFNAENNKVDGLGIINITTTSVEKRLIGNVVLQSELFSQKIVGFENHSGNIDIGSYSPLGKVLTGYGNNERGESEGVVYKNFIGTNLHGPLLPKNPMLCDYILSCALKKKYDDFDGLEALDDELENLANEYIVKTFAESK